MSHGEAQLHRELLDGCLGSTSPVQRYRCSPRQPCVRPIRQDAPGQGRLPTDRYRSVQLPKSLALRAHEHVHGHEPGRLHWTAGPLATAVLDRPLTRDVERVGERSRESLRRGHHAGATEQLLQSAVGPTFATELEGEVDQWPRRGIDFEVVVLATAATQLARGRPTAPLSDPVDLESHASADAALAAELLIGASDRLQHTQTQGRGEGRCGQREPPGCGWATGPTGRPPRKDHQSLPTMRLADEPQVRPAHQSEWGPSAGSHGTTGTKPATGDGAWPNPRAPRIAHPVSAALNERSGATRNRRGCSIERSELQATIRGSMESSTCRVAHELRGDAPR